MGPELKTPKIPLHSIGFLEMWHITQGLDNFLSENSVYGLGL